MYLTHSINADIFFVVRAGSAIFNFAGHSKEEVIVFCNAVELADVFICTEKRKRGIIKNDGITCKMHKLFFKFYCLVSLQLQRLLTLQVCTKTETQKTATTNAPRGIHMGLQVYFVVQIRSVITGKSLQPSLIKINDDEGDLAQGPRRQFRICSSLDHPPFISSLNRPGTTAKHTAPLHCTLFPLLCVTKLARRLPF